MRGVARAELATRRGSRLAVVTATHPHSDDGDENNYEVDVRLKHEPLDLTRVPIVVAYLGFAATPKVGDLVLVEFLGGDPAQPVVVGCLYHSAERPPRYDDGEIVLAQRLPDGGDNELRFAKDGTVRVKVGDKITLTLAADGITLSAPDVPVKIECQELDVKGDTTIQGDLVVKGGGGSTTISGHQITGA
ncbi:phage baseplate assembly protein V [Kutzneria sp. NPDC052558]|uniref:phage baseplate assembly protein V n=1 Tax=Kutzneria sp. NPDC052558 TaxID=3364121 RepID=UPI0037C58907